MLELIGLSKRFGDVVALDGADLVARPGRILGFLGPNGAGKTTAMRSVFGLVSLDAGAVAWKGSPVDSAAWRHFGYMPEQRGLYPKMKVGAQIAWLARLRGMERQAAVRATEEVLGRLGLGARIEARLEALSHGNQQRAQVAACLVHDPELLVLDEPFSGLDPTGVDAMSAVIGDRASQGAAVVFSSHQLDLVEDVCDDVAIIHRGRVVVSGSLREVRGSTGMRRLEVGFDDPSTSWAPGNGTVLSRSEGKLICMVPDGADFDRLLAEARAAGRVGTFSFGPPRLSEVFREAVRS